MSDDPADDTDEAVNVPERAVTVTSLRERVADIEARLDAAETEADLDEVAADIDAVETDVEDTDLDPEETDDETDPVEAIEDDVDDLRADLEEARGPYIEDVVEVVESARASVERTEWVADGVRAVRSALDDLLVVVEGVVGQTFDRPAAVESAADAGEGEGDGDGDEPFGDPVVTAGETVGTLDAVLTAFDGVDLDPDADAATVETLLEAATAFEDAVDGATGYDDLTVRGKLDAHGFYDVLEHRKDFPPEWNAVKVFEQRGNPEPILLALEELDSEFMEGHCVEALKRLGDEAALDAMQQRAQRRNKPAVEVLGKLGSTEPLEMLSEYAETDSDPGLQKVTLRALGEIGSRESTQVVADRLASDHPNVRSRAARALGMIGDTRAIDPLADTLEADETDRVRASAAWALRQIGTERALSVVADYEHDPDPLVQAEAERVA